MATVTNTNSKATRIRRGFPHRCPICGAPDALKVSLDDMSNLSCEVCSQDVTPDVIRGVIEQWERLMVWLETCPEYQK